MISQRKCIKHDDNTSGSICINVYFYSDDSSPGFVLNPLHNELIYPSHPIISPILEVVTELLHKLIRCLTQGHISSSW